MPLTLVIVSLLLKPLFLRQSGLSFRSLAPLFCQGCFHLWIHVLQLLRMEDTSKNPSKSRAVQQASTPEWGCTLWDTEVLLYLVRRCICLPTNPRRRVSTSRVRARSLCLTLL